MALNPFTSADQVRSVLGVSDEEIADTTLDLLVYEQNLKFHLDSVDATARTQFQTVDDIVLAARTATQQKLWEATMLFSTYVVAVQVGKSMSLSTPKSITDGKAAVTRFSDSPFRQLMEELLYRQ